MNWQPFLIGVALATGCFGFGYFLGWAVYTYNRYRADRKTRGAK